MKIALIAFTEQGKALADRLALALGGVADRCGGDDALGPWTARHFDSADGLIFVGAAGIAVRAIAPHIRSKAKDPAVVVVDERGTYAVPILSGHLGGANALARRVAEVCGAQAVITTATDRNGVFPVDEWARVQGCDVPFPDRIKAVSARLLAGGTIRVFSPWPVEGAVPAGVEPAAAGRRPTRSCWSRGSWCWALAAAAIRRRSESSRFSCASWSGTASGRRRFALCAPSTSRRGSRAFWHFARAEPWPSRPFLPGRWPRWRGTSRRPTMCGG